MSEQLLWNTCITWESGNNSRSGGTYFEADDGNQQQEYTVLYNEYKQLDYEAIHALWRSSF